MILYLAVGMHVLPSTIIVGFSKSVHNSKYSFLVTIVTEIIFMDEKINTLILKP